jgi:hypothetical protein
MRRFPLPQIGWSLDQGFADNDRQQRAAPFRPSIANSNNI